MNPIQQILQNLLGLYRFYCDNSPLIMISFVSLCLLFTYWVISKIRYLFRCSINPKSKCIIVTGAASGIGLKTTKTLLKMGCHVYAIDLSISALEDTLGSFDDVTLIQCDVTKSTQIRQLYNKVCSDGHLIYGIVNNAGIPGPNAPLTEIPMSSIDLVFNINTFGPIRFINQFKHHLIETEGCVVNISSIAGIIASPFLGPYCASKVALEFITDVYRREFASYLPQGSDPYKKPVRIVAVNPWFANTNIYSKSRQLTNQIRLQPGALRDRIEKALSKSSQLDMIDVQSVADGITASLFDPSPPLNRIIAPFHRLGMIYMAQVAPKWVTDFLLISSKFKKKLLQQIKEK